MGYSYGFDSKWQRDVGYGVPAKCDHPDCDKEIDRGLSYVCGADFYGGEHGCGLHFCSDHLGYDEDYGFDFEGQHYDDRDCQLCERCLSIVQPFDLNPDTKEWVHWKLTDESWKQWREENPEQVKTMKEFIKLERRNPK